MEHLYRQKPNNHQSKAVHLLYTWKSGSKMKFEINPSMLRVMNNNINNQYIYSQMIIFINDAVYKSRTALDFLWLLNAEMECVDYCLGS